MAQGKIAVHRALLLAVREQCSRIAALHPSNSELLGRYSDVIMDLQIDFDESLWEDDDVRKLVTLSARMCSIGSRIARNAAGRAWQNVSAVNASAISAATEVTLSAAASVAVFESASAVESIS